MQRAELGSGPLRIKDPRREAMLEPEDVSAMLRLNELGWGAKRIARELGVSRNTAKEPIRGGRLDAVSAPGAQKGARRAGGVAEGAVASPSRQCRQ